MRKIRLSHNFSWIIAFAFVICLTIILTSGAFFSDSTNTNSANTLRFGAVSINIPEGLLFEASELIPGNTNIVRDITFTNNGNVDAYIRFSCLITMNGERITKTKTNGMEEETIEFLTFTVNNTWEKHDNYYFYGIISANQTISTRLTFSVSEDFGNELSNQTIAFTLTADTSQANNQSSTYSEINW